VNAIEIIDLKYCIRDQWTYRLKELLSPFSLNIAQGEAFGFLGHNGAGKTTTIKCILGFLQATAGQINILGENNRTAAARKSVGYLSEQPYFYDYLTVRETLKMFAVLSDIASSAVNERVNYIAEKVQMSARLDSPMRTLSKGLTQRVGLAQALIHSPKVLILDEPFSGLDPIGRREFREIFAELKNGGTTLFMSSHVLPDVEFLCDRVSILAQGKLKGVFDLNNLPSSANASFELTIEGDRKLARETFSANTTQIREDREGLRCSFATEKEAALGLERAVNSNFSVVRYARERGNLEQLFESLVSYKEGGAKS